MSDTEHRMPLAQADLIASHLITMKLNLPGDHTFIVGSIRRRKPDVGDIEILTPAAACWPGTAPPGIDPAFMALEAVTKPKDGLFVPLNAMLTEVSGHKPHFKHARYRMDLQLTKPDTGWADLVDVGLDVFRYTKENRGWQLLMRTGPAIFGEWFLTKWKRAKGIREGNGSVEGHLVDAFGSVVPVFHEEQCFEHIKVPFIPVDRRDAFAKGLEERGSW